MAHENNEDPLLSAIGHQFEPTTFTYNERDVALYALAIGAAADPLDSSELQFVYELHQGGFRCLPTFAATFPLQTLEQITAVPGLKLDLLQILHGEQFLELPQSLPTQGTITSQAYISQVYDKGSGALIVVQIDSYDEQGAHVALNRAGIFVRGRGNFGGERGPSSLSLEAPERTPDAIVNETTAADQALFYRLSSGDRNPLHADIRFANMLGFERPILHGLCTYGFAGRAVLKSFAGNDPALLRSIGARFSQYVLPGETISTEMWQTEEEQILFRSRILEREALVLTQGVAMLAGRPAADAMRETAVPRSRSIFAEIDKRIASHPEWVDQIGAVFQFEVSGVEGGSYIVDLQHSPGAARPGTDSAAACRISMTYEDFRAMLKGELKPEMAFLSGKLQVTGNVLLATKLGPLFAQRE